jgi:bifunctional enzyme CysN/CysC
LSAETDPKDLLRLATAGSVDDGKSTLIGRLLYETEGVYEDQLISIRKASSNGNGPLDLSLITDGLKAEREQAITIDVAYRYFATPRRKFILADTPGHEQYTRNMVTAASTADLALLLVDARRGVLSQTRRHGYLAWLLGIRHFILAVNKMDLIGFSRDAYDNICDEFLKGMPFLNGVGKDCVPISALEGDNIVIPSNRMIWYQGQTLLQLLETVSIEDARNLQDFRFPVQNVIRPNQDFRGYAGQVVSGIAVPNQKVTVLPSLQSAAIEGVFLHDQMVPTAFPPMSVILSLSTQVDLGRGDMIVDPDRMPAVSKRVSANLIWMSRTPLSMNSPYLIRHTTQTLCGSVTFVRHKIDISTFEPMKTNTLEVNDIGVVEIETHKPMFCDIYTSNRATGSFIMIDPADNNTVAAGMILETSISGDARKEQAFSEDLQTVSIRRQTTGLTVWFTGLSGSGKTTICRSVYTELLARGIRAELLDADELRKHLNCDLGFTKEDRDENIRRIGFVANLLTRNGVVALVTAISPYRATREEVRRTIGNFVEVYVDTRLGICEDRDPKGLYKQARAGQIRGFTGIDDPYEPPLAADVQCNTEHQSLKTSTEEVLSAIFCLIRPDAKQSTPSAE